MQKREHIFGGKFVESLPIFRVRSDCAEIDNDQIGFLPQIEGTNRGALPSARAAP